jgi:hypothetical protein
MDADTNASLAVPTYRTIIQNRYSERREHRMAKAYAAPLIHGLLKCAFLGLCFGIGGPAFFRGLDKQQAREMVDPTYNTFLAGMGRPFQRDAERNKFRKDGYVPSLRDIEAIAESHALDSKYWPSLADAKSPEDLQALATQFKLREDRAFDRASVKSRTAIVEQRFARTRIPDSGHFVLPSYLAPDETQPPTQAPQAQD